MATKKKTRAELKAERREKRHYGMTIINKGEKLAWLSIQNKYGWSLGLAMNKYTSWLRNIRFASKVDVERMVGGGGKIVFVELKNNK